jgi:carboxyl-terminal processing protease
MLRPGTGYVDMSRGFNYTTSAELERALEFLRTQGMTQLVLDLRGNPGGFLDQAVRVAEKFLTRGQRILSQKGREGERSYDSKNSQPDQTPLVVLINRASASASEIVAGALQDHDRALIVGETSFGKGLVQSIINLDTGAGVAGLTLTSAKYYTPSGRLIQRDYSTGSTYDYYTRGGISTRTSGKPTTPQATKPTGAESRTDTGRVVYGGGGISPDDAVAPREFEPSQVKFLDPLFAFTRELVNNRVAGLTAYKVQRPLDFEHNLQATDFPVTDEVFANFKRFVAANPAFKVTPAQIDRQQEFLRRQLRFNIVTAAYGSVAATRVLIADDPQVARAVQSMPRARELAMAAARTRTAQRKPLEQ